MAGSPTVPKEISPRVRDVAAKLYGYGFRLEAGGVWILYYPPGDRYGRQAKSLAAQALETELPMILREEEAYRRVASFVQLTAPGTGYYSYQPNTEQYGLPVTIRALTTVATQWSLKHKAPRLGIGDISMKDGRKFGKHKSHQKGVDADVRAVRNDGTEGPVVWSDAKFYSRLSTQQLVDMIRNNGVLRVHEIWFNDSLLKGVKPMEGHDDHLHVRFVEP